MIRCLIPCALCVCSVLASGPVLGQVSIGNSDASPPTTATVEPVPAGGTDAVPTVVPAETAPESQPGRTPSTTTPAKAVPSVTSDLTPPATVPAQSAPPVTFDSALATAVASAEAQFKIFKLENISAKDAEKIITQLFGKDLTTLAADERSNQLIVRDDNADTLKQIEAILLKLDDSAQKQLAGGGKNPLNPANRLTAPVTGPAPGAMPLASPRADLGVKMISGFSLQIIDRVEQAKTQYQTAEKRAAELAAQLQERSKSNPQDPKLPEMRKQLQEAVADAFAKRQELHKMELADLEQRVQKVQESLQARETIRDQIIERRVEELLNPNVNWDSTAADSSKPKVPKAASTPAQVQGVILNVSQDKKFVEISLGQNDGMVPKTALHVFTGHRHLGQIEVVEVIPDQSVARILQQQPGFPIRRGDQVTTRWPLEAGQQSQIGLPGPAQLPGLPAVPGKGGTSSLGPTSDAKDAMSIQLHIRGPKGAMLEWDKDPMGGDPALAENELPARIPGETGQLVSFQIKNIPGREGLELWPSIELAPKTPPIEAFLKHNAIPVEFTDEDLDQYASGNIIVKVIFLPHPNERETAVGEAQTLVSAKVDPGKDPVAEARRRGHILAVVRLVNRVPKTQLSYDPLQYLSAPLTSQLEELTREQLGDAVSKQQAEADKISKQLAAKDLSPNERNRLKAEDIQARMGVASLKVQLAQTYPKESDDFKKHLRSAIEDYGKLYREYRSQYAGVRARYLEASWLYYLGETDQASAIAKELLNVPDDGPHIVTMKNAIRGMLSGKFHN